MVLRYQEQKEKQEWLVLQIQKERFAYGNLFCDVNRGVWDHLEVLIKFQICMLHFTTEKRTAKELLVLNILLYIYNILPRALPLPAWAFSFQCFLLIP